MKLTVRAARDLAERVMAALGHDATDAALIADHLIDCELRGLGYGGLARAISIAERLARTGDRRGAIRILHETPVSARLDGGDQLGYLVAHRAADRDREGGNDRHRRCRRQRHLVHGHVIVLRGDRRSARAGQRHRV
jgi:LDH2 family malate/lactate/ureidoglycolate dehydrogenase